MRRKDRKEQTVTSCERLNSHPVFLVRMRSAVRICPAAPEKQSPPVGWLLFCICRCSNCRPPIERGAAERKRHHSTRRLWRHALWQFESARVGDHSARLGKGGGVTDRLFLICAACLLLPKSDPLRRALILNVTGSDEGCAAGGRQQRRRIKGRSPSLIAPSPRRGFESAIGFPLLCKSKSRGKLSNYSIIEHLSNIVLRI